ncbi:MAG TPA: hypothetical protein VD887_01535 [Allosphingosinicella sp.]|nr:hypothetical protein [Allosphingosinicella sp.]
MAWPRLLCLVALLVAAAPVAAQTVATSARPDSVAITIYRDPDRDADENIDPDWLEGYALVTETRRVSIPAGASELRFEGVAGGILPQSAIVTGLPEDVLEKNHDAYLLSPASLLDRSLGRRVHIRRTSQATGAVTEEEAVIRSGSGGAVVLQTRAGIEALRCTGGVEALVYPGVPEGLPARPTLSVRTRSSRPVAATVTLSYLAGGFDWRANYVMTLSPEGDSAQISAWLTLASMDETSFIDAETMAVAGRINREDEDEAPEPPQPNVQLRCWPGGRTHEVPSIDPPAPPSAPANVVSESVQRISSNNEGADDTITVTGTLFARQEELGDVKLYRLPERVTVASNSQKQVAFILPRSVRVQSVYRSRIRPDDDGDQSVTRILVTRNRTQEGLGLPLPAGGVVLFGAGRERPLLLGEGSLDDRAVGEDVEIALNGDEDEYDGEVPGLTARVENTDDGEDWEDFVLTVTNDRPYPIAYQAEFDVADDERLRARTRLARRNGRPFWTVTVPANGTATLRYRVFEVEAPPERDED